MARLKHMALLSLPSTFPLPLLPLPLLPFPLLPFSLLSFPFLTVEQQRNTRRKACPTPATPTIQLSRRNRITPKIFCSVGRYTPIIVPRLAWRGGRRGGRRGRAEGGEGGEGGDGGKLTCAGLPPSIHLLSFSGDFCPWQTRG